MKVVLPTSLQNAPYSFHHGSCLSSSSQQTHLSPTGFELEVTATVGRTDADTVATRATGRVDEAVGTPVPDIPADIPVSVKVGPLRWPREPTVAFA